jgi:hypothetical protein
MSAVSVWEQFLGTDWERYATVSSRITCGICAVVGVLSILFNFNIGIGFWSIFSALILAIWEFPTLFAMVPNFDKFKEILMENFFFKLDEMRGLLYFGLSIFCFFGSLCVISGLALLVSACLLGFAAVNRRVDALDGMSESESSGSGMGMGGMGMDSTSVPYQQRSANNAFVNSSDDVNNMNTPGKVYSNGSNSPMSSLLPR